METWKKYRYHAMGLLKLHVKTTRLAISHIDKQLKENKSLVGKTESANNHYKWFVCALLFGEESS